MSKKVAYLLSQFPALSETFVLNEVMISSRANLAGAILKGISLDQYAGKSTQEVLRELYGMGVLGIRKMAPKRVEEVIGK